MRRRSREKSRQTPQKGGPSKVRPSAPQAAHALKRKVPSQGRRAQAPNVGAQLIAHPSGLVEWVNNPDDADWYLSHGGVAVESIGRPRREGTTTLPRRDASLDRPLPKRAAEALKRLPGHKAPWEK